MYSTNSRRELPLYTGGTETRTLLNILGYYNNLICECCNVTQYWPTFIHNTFDCKDYNVELLRHNIGYQSVQIPGFNMQPFILYDGYIENAL